MENKTFEDITKNTDKLNEFKEFMENMYLKGLREMPTFTEEMHQKIEEEFKKMYKDAELFFGNK